MRLFHVFNNEALADYAAEACRAIHSAGAITENSITGRMEFQHLTPCPTVEDLAGCALAGIEPQYATPSMSAHSDYPARFTRIEGEELIIDTPHDMPTDEDAVSVALPKRTERKEERAMYFTKVVEENDGTRINVASYEVKGVAHILSNLHEDMRDVRGCTAPTEGELAWYLHKSIEEGLAFYFPMNALCVPYFEKRDGYVVSYDPREETEGYIVEPLPHGIRVTVKTPDHAVTTWTWEW